MIRLIFQKDEQTGAETWGCFFKTLDLNLPQVEHILGEGWTFKGLEVPAPTPGREEE